MTPDLRQVCRSAQRQFLDFRALLIAVAYGFWFRGWPSSVVWLTAWNLIYCLIYVTMMYYR